MNKSFGFIIIRHVHSEKTNAYWNRSVKLLSILYPTTKIVIIDDNSDLSYVKADSDYTNVHTVVQSEFHKRGELLPYYYLLKHKFFPNAIIIHDSVFFHKKIHFDKIHWDHLKVLPLWHFHSDTENVSNTNRIIRHLQNGQLLKDILNKDTSISMSQQYKWVGCFGAMCLINLSFLEKIECKYKITNLVNAIQCRADRCCFERIIGAIFCMECPELKVQQSLLGNIMTYISWGYRYEDYINDVVRTKVSKPIIKVWSGR